MTDNKDKDFEGLKKKFDIIFGSGKSTDGSLYSSNSTRRRRIKSFIIKAYECGRKSRDGEIIEMLYGMMKDEYPTEDGVPVETYGYEETHNKALLSAISSIGDKRLN